MSSDALMDELQSFLDMGATPPGEPSPGRAKELQTPTSPPPGGAPGTEKRKIDSSPGLEDVGSYSLNSPAKVARLETVKVEGGGLVRSDSLGNLRSVEGLGGGMVMEEQGGSRSGQGFLDKEGGKERGAEGYIGHEINQEQGCTGEQDPKKSTATAARIRGALEASGLSGNLTAEDLQTLKRLNEIAKSTHLSQEQKSGEASHLLKNNPNVSRLLLKLRTEKNAQSQAVAGGHQGGAGGQGQMGSGGGGQERMGVQEGGYFGMQPGLRAPPPVGGPMGYGSPGTYGSPGGPQGHGPGGPQGHGPGGPQGHGPGGPQGHGQVYRGQGGGGGLQDAGFYRGGLVHGNQGRGSPLGPGMLGPELGHLTQQGLRMHPDMGGPGAMGMRVPGGHMYTNMQGPMERGRMVGMGGRLGPGEPGPQTMYVNRQTGMMYPEHSVMGQGRPPFYQAPQYMQGFHPGGQGMMAREHQAPRPYTALGPRGLPAGMYGAPQGGPHAGYDTFGGPGLEVRGRWEEGRESLVTSIPRGSPQPPASDSQLRARLSGITTSAGSSELASRLLSPRQGYEQQGYGGQHQQGPPSFFEEINASAYVGDQTRAPGRAYSPYNTGSWKDSPNTGDLRAGWLRRLTTALETSTNIAPCDSAARMAASIEKEAFQNSSTEAHYTNNIAVHLAGIFARSKEAMASCPDSTSKADEGEATSPDFGSSPSGANFHSDTTLNCFQVRGL